MRPDTLRNFTEIRDKDSRFDREQLPDRVEGVVNSEADLSTLFEVALSYWQAIFDKVTLKKDLEEFLQTKPKVREKELRKRLKTIRKAGLILGTAYHFCNSDPALPRQFVHFLRHMGRVNDAFSMKKGNKNAEKVLKILEDHDLSQIQLTISSVNTYKQRFEAFINHAIRTLDKKEIPLDEYHTLRKNLRHIMNLFQLAAANNPEDQRIKQTFQYMCDLNSDLGKVHDIYVKQELKGKIDYDETTLEIPKALRSRVNSFLSAIR